MGEKWGGVEPGGSPPSPPQPGPGLLAAALSVSSAGRFQGSYQEERYFLEQNSCHLALNGKSFAVVAEHFPDLLPKVTPPTGKASLPGGPAPPHPTPPCRECLWGPLGHSPERLRRGFRVAAWPCATGTPCAGRGGHRPQGETLPGIQPGLLPALRGWLFQGRRAALCGTAGARVHQASSSLVQTSAGGLGVLLLARVPLSPLRSFGGPAWRPTSPSLQILLQATVFARMSPDQKTLLVRSLQGLR